ncbi:hypothetical protein AB0J79_09980 [Rhodococcus coprophilus]|uniref:DUF1016 N-terminal domain-containing protein n=1 Tax=Rhodococcus coprophilus TaxID=38310 RepID=UPI0034264CDF
MSGLIERIRAAVATQADSEFTLMNWQIGHLIDTEVLAEQRAEYAQEIVVTLSRQLSWCHFIALIAADNDAARASCIQQRLDAQLSFRARRELIGRQYFERREIANAHALGGFAVPLDTFSGPYFLDFLGLKDAYAELDLEDALVRETEPFLLDVGIGWAFELGSRSNRWRCTRTVSSPSIGRRCHRKKSCSGGSRRSLALRKNESRAAHSVGPATTRTTNE